MKIAVLVLAFNSSLGLKSLIRLFNAVEINVYVHVDAKIDAKPFCEVEKAEVKFISNRKRIFWRGFTMVEATIALICAAVDDGGYDRYIIISDDSLPTVKMRELRNKIELGEDYISVGIAPEIF